MTKHVADVESRERERPNGAGPSPGATRRAVAGCPSLRVLSAAAAEDLPPNERRAVDEHVAACETCRAFQADLAALAPDALALRAVESGLGGVRRRAARDARSARRFRWRGAIAMSAVAVLAVVVVWRTSAPTSLPTGSAAAAAMAIAAPEAVPASGELASEAPLEVGEGASRVPAGTSADAGPALEPAEIKFTTAALSWRTPAAGGELLAAMAPGIAAYRAKRFEEAERDFAALQPRFPSAVEVPFYLGVSQLFLGRNQQAVASLDSAAALTDDTFAADISWYRAIALERVGRRADAHEELAALCGGGSSYAARACQAARR